MPFIYIQDIDDSILIFIQENLRSPILDLIMKPVTYLGSGGVLWIIISLIFIISKKYRYNGLMLAGALILCLIIGNLTLKLLVARLRPSDVNTTIELLIKRPTDFSFPSGHSLSSFSSATVIFYTDKRYGAAAAIIAAMIAFSRLYLYVHYPSDVFAGIVIGISIGLVTIYIALKIKPKLNKFKKLSKLL
ncbi:MAG: phosphoesterase PA-phosphatase related [Clostridia bacterium]|nr:phosphoesterase PA-phosphatase related [Clostridia bacterium]